MKKLSVYIHIPFCSSKCYYCDFCSSVQSEQEKSRYVDALVKEIELSSDNLADYVCDTIFIGGGTPSTLSISHIDKIISSLNHYLRIDIKEFTIEANPEHISLEKLNYYKNMGINRLSMGVQSYDDRLLDIIGRHAKSSDIKKALDLATRVFDNVSCDVMLGLPSQNSNSVLSTLDELTSYDIKHLSAYSLSLESGTKLFNLIKTGKIKLPSEDETVDMYDLVCDYLSAKQFHRYEVSNFAKDGYESSHNIAYWIGKDYIGYGAAASSFINETRYSHTRDVNSYIVKLLENNVCDKLDENIISLEDRKFERIMLGLRMDKGLDVIKFNFDFNTDFCTEYSEAINKCKNFTEFDDKNFRILSQYMYVMNSIIVEFKK